MASASSFSSLRGPSNPTMRSAAAPQDPPGFCLSSSVSSSLFRPIAPSAAAPSYEYTSILANSGPFDQVRAASRAFMTFTQEHYRHTNSAPPRIQSGPNAMLDEDDEDYALTDKDNDNVSFIAQIRTICEENEEFGEAEQKQILQCIQNIREMKANHLEFYFACHKIREILNHYIPISSGETKVFLERLVKQLEPLPLFRMEGRNPNAADVGGARNIIWFAIDCKLDTDLIMLLKLATEQPGYNFFALIKKEIAKELDKEQPPKDVEFIKTLINKLAALYDQRLINIPQREVVDCLRGWAARVDVVDLFDVKFGNYDPRPFLNTAYSNKSVRLTELFRNQVMRMPLTPSDKEFCIHAAQDPDLQRMLLQSEPLFAKRAKATREDSEKSQDSEEEYLRILMLEDKVALIKEYVTAGIFSAHTLMKTLKNAKELEIPENILRQFVNQG